MNKMKKNLQSNILLLPALIAGFFCYLFPILIAFGKSFFLGTGTDFVGIQNYVDLFENEAFSLAVRNLFHLWTIIVPVNLVIGIFIAEVYIKLRKEKLCLFFLVPSILPAACEMCIRDRSIMEEQESRRELYDGLKRLTQREQTYLLYRYGFTDGEEHPLIGTAIYLSLIHI